MPSPTAATLQASYDALWPPSPRSTDALPHLRIDELSLGTRPACAAPFWLYLSGLFRSFASHTSNTARFLDGSAPGRCWFLVLFTTDEAESALFLEKIGLKVGYFVMATYDVDSRDQGWEIFTRKSRTQLYAKIRLLFSGKQCKNNRHFFTANGKPPQKSGQVQISLC